MTSSDPQRAKELFLAALELPVDRRDRFLEEACPSDLPLRARVERLLAAHDHPNSALHQFQRLDGDDPSRQTRPLDADSGFAAPSAVASVAEALVGATLDDKYQLVRRIGLGGMGCVYLAEQLRPVRRQVAVKVLRGATLPARFAAERQALALMDHPCIARFFDSGFTDAGLPYFVMELVHGTPLTEFCDERRLTIPDRLALFRQICSAIQHAHQRGIIHRDLKPSNILVEQHDSTPSPKIIDFGLAKALAGPSLAESSQFTPFGVIAGTPLYMAPEQATLNALDVDTRADVYALGVILFELLTGTTPLERDALQRAAFDEILRTIRDQEPPTPSSRLSSAQITASVAATRQIEPSRLTRLCRGDLDWIVVKALARQRDARYESAAALGQDVERYLNDEPVTAGPPSLVYRFRKFARRHRRSVFAAGLILAALCAGLIGLSIGYVQAERAREAAQQAERRAEQRARLAEALRDFVRYDLLEQADIRRQDAATSPRRSDPTVRDLLDRASRRIDERFREQPLVEAEVRFTLGVAYRAIGHYDLAEQHARRAAELRDRELGPEHLDSLQARDLLNGILTRQGRDSTAAEEFRRQLDDYSQVVGPDHAYALTSKNNLALAQQFAGEFDEAERLFREVLDERIKRLGVAHPDTFASKHNLAGIYWQRRTRLAEAARLFEEVRAWRQEWLGPNHPDTLVCQSNLALVYQELGQLDRAEEQLRELQGALQGQLPADHPDVLTFQNNLASLFVQRQAFQEAADLFERVLETRRRVLGDQHRDTLTTRYNLAVTLRRMQRLADAEPHLVAAWEGTRQSLGLAHPMTRQVVASLSGLYGDLQDYRRLEPLLRERVEFARQRHGAQSPEAAGELATLGLCLVRAERYADAELALRECLELRRDLSPQDWRRSNTQSMLGAALLGQARYADAEPLLREGFSQLAAQARSIPAHLRRPLLLDAVDRLIRLAERTNRSDEAASWRERRTTLDSEWPAPATAPSAPHAPTP